MKSKMLLDDRAVGKVPRQGAVLGQGIATGVKTGGCRRTARPRQRGFVVKTRAILGLSCDFTKWTRRVCTWRHRCPQGPLGIGNMF